MDMVYLTNVELIGYNFKLRYYISNIEIKIFNKFKNIQNY